MSGDTAPLPVLGLAPAAAPAQVAGQLLAQGAPGLDVEVVVDRFGRHPPSWVMRVLLAQPLGDLLGRPLLFEQALDAPGEVGMALELEYLGTARLLYRPVLGPLRVIAPERAVAPDLPQERRPGRDPARPLWP